MTPDKSILNILQEFAINGNRLTWTPLTAGLINDTYLVAQDSSAQFILQKINHKVFKNIKGLMDNIDHVLPVLKTEGYTQLSFLSTINGKPYLQKNGEYWRIMTFIPNSRTYDTTTNSKIAFEGGRIIGTFHSLLNSVDITQIKDTLPRFHDLGFRIQEFKEALNITSYQKRQMAKTAIDKAHHFLEELQVLENEKLPLRICHNDTKLNNILFSERTQKALCLIDLDTLMKGYFYYDFGDAIRTIANAAPEDETNLSKITFNKNVFKSFIDGLASLKPFLSPLEKDSLPLGAVYLPFLHGLRALPDLSLFHF